MQRRLSALALLLSLGACAPSPLADGERRQALRVTTEDVILPTLAEVTERAQQLAELSQELERAPEDAELSALRQAYLDLRAPWEESWAFGFGPATELHSQAAIDQAPVDRDQIEQQLEGDAELSLAHLRSLGANKRGLHAIEYLLFPEQETSEALLSDDASGSRRRQYLQAASRLVADAASELEAAWDPERGGYARRFSEPGAPDSVAQSVQVGLDTLLNEAVFLSEVVANGKLGKPLGADNGGEIDGSAQESELAQASLADVLGNLRGIRNVYLASREGGTGPSLSSLVRRRSPGADRHAREALDQAEESVMAIPEPLTRALQEEPESVTAAYESVKNLKRVLSSEVLSTLGASLKFNDNDGD